MQVILNEDQRKALKMLQSGSNVFLTGKAGTGKSTLLDYYINNASKIGFVVKCAPTGIAAHNIGGATIHRAFKLNTDAKLKLPTEDEITPVIYWADVIIVDEISMCRIDLFEYIVNIIRLAEKKRNKKKQIIVVGDFYQLPPILPDWEIPEFTSYYHGEVGKGYAFQSRLWRLMNFKYIELKKVMRQSDAGFVQALDGIREGDKSASRWIKAHSRRTPDPYAYNIVATKDEAERINQVELCKLDPKTEKVYNMQIYGEVREDDMRAPKTLTLRVGAKVMILVNDTSGDRFVNGSYGRVVELRGNDVVVAIEDKMISFKPYIWESIGYKLTRMTEEYIHMPGEFKLDTYAVGWHSQIPMRLAWATTIHKAQGQTYDAVNINAYNAWEDGQVYTALSRVRDAGRMYIHGILDPATIHSNKDVIEFYKDPENYKTMVKGPYY